MKINQSHPALASIYTTASEMAKFIASVKKERIKKNTDSQHIGGVNFEYINGQYVMSFTNGRDEKVVLGFLTAKEGVELFCKHC